jgi:hypothetical protein
MNPVQPGHPTIVCLVGSRRFKSEFEKVTSDLTLKGTIVIGPGVWLDVSRDEKSRLDELHRQKIDMSDEVYVINPGGYIGVSTRNEIMHAWAMLKPVNYLVQPPDDRPPHDISLSESDDDLRKQRHQLIHERDDVRAKLEKTIQSLREANVRALETAYLKDQVSQFKQMNANQVQTIRARGEEVVELEEKLTAARDQVKSIGRLNESLRQTIVNLESDLRATREVLEGQRRETAGAEARQQTLLDNLVRIEGERNRARVERDSRTKERDQARLDYTRLIEERNQARDNLDKLRLAHDVLASRLRGEAGPSSNLTPSNLTATAWKHDLDPPSQPSIGFNPDDPDDLTRSNWPAPI